MAEVTPFFLFSAAFLACAVEMVEALTIVLAVGVTRGWRSAIIGTATALAALAVVVAALGPALSALPINGLRIFVGGLLLVFGLQWLRKAILRASGLKAHAPLSRVPENTMKFAVGVMLTTFGIFWAGEGAGAKWPGGDGAIVGVLAYVLVTSFLMVSALRRRRQSPATARALR